MSFYVFVIVLGLSYLCYLCWQTRYQSENYQRYSRICSSGLLSTLCHQHKSDLHSSHLFTITFLVIFYWCIYKFFILIEWTMWEIYFILIFGFVTNYFYFLKKQLILVLAEKYVLHL